MGDLIDLPDNMVGASTLPQTKVIPQVDLVITHGGNNTTTEALHFGKPMVVLPLFWDQYDNAQRVDELDLGVRLDTYAFTDDQLIAAVDGLLADTGAPGPVGNGSGRGSATGRGCARRPTSSNASPAAHADRTA